MRFERVVPPHMTAFPSQQARGKALDDRLRTNRPYGLQHRAGEAVPAVSPASAVVASRSAERVQRDSLIRVAFRNEMATAGLTSTYESERSTEESPFIAGIAGSVLARQK